MSRVRTTLLLAALLWAATAALAQSKYQWLDAAGNHVYSDLPPPAGTPEKNILTNATAVDPDNAAPASGPSREQSLADKNAAALQRKVDAAAKVKQTEEKTQQAKVAATRAENCKRARDYKRGLDSGMRMARVNAQGERVVLDDAARGAELQRTADVIAQNCGKAP